MALYVFRANVCFAIILSFILPSKSDVPKVCDDILYVCCKLSPEVTLNQADKSCSLPTSNGVCVPFYQCENQKIITDGRGIIDIKSTTNHDVDSRDRTETVCVTAFDRLVQRPSADSIGCGVRRVDGFGFQLNFNSVAKETGFGEFPWTSAVLKKDRVRDAFAFHCVGALIHPSVVLTVANCVDGVDLSSVKVRLGEWNTMSGQELFPHHEHSVAEVIIHEAYQEANLHNNIALLMLTKPVRLGDNVQTVCLPPQDFIFDSGRCIASGWGKDQWGKNGRYQTVLKKVDLPIVPRRECEEKLRTDRLGHYFNLHSSFICAGGEEGKNTYVGDGGAPLVCPVPFNRVYHLAGLAAWGILHTDTIPGAYVNVALFRDWIDQKFRCKKLDSSFYTIRY